MDLLSFLFPPRCLGCAEIGTYLCPMCVNQFKPIYETRCPLCRKPSALGQTHSRCRSLFSIDGAMSGFDYSGLMTRAITKYKYAFVRDLNQTLVELLISSISHPQLFNHSWTLVPVPLHSSRLKWRGFNQAEVLADGLSFAWKMPISNTLLIRVLSTTPQMKLSGAERKRSLKNAFEVQKKVPIPTHVLLVDDVLTTGSTLNECARALKKAGVKSVWGVTLAQKILPL